MRYSGPADLPALLDHWVAARIITPEQAARMRADLGRRFGLHLVPAPPGHRQGSLAIEALGYLGSVLIVVASVLFVSAYWDELSTTGHLVIVGGAVVTLLLAGFAVPQQLGQAGRRLHAVLWFGACLCAAGFLGVFGAEVLAQQDEDLALLIFAGTTILAALLWWRHPTSLQQVAVVVGLAGTAASAAAELPLRGELAPGVALWGVGAVWFLLGWGSVVRPRWTALLLGGIALMVGPGLTVPTDAGIVLALITTAVLVVIAVLARDLLVLGLGAWGAVQFLPVAINEWFPGELAAAATLLAVGSVLVVAAIWIAWRPRAATSTYLPPRRYDAIPERTAWLAAGVVTLAVTAAVLLLGQN
jgi:hypothetical protein